MKRPANIIPPPVNEEDDGDAEELVQTKRIVKCPICLNTIGQGHSQKDGIFYCFYN